MSSPKQPLKVAEKTSMDYRGKTCWQRNSCSSFYTCNCHWNSSIKRSYY